MYGFCRSISKVVTMIHGFNREVDGGIEILGSRRLYPPPRGSTS